jgi:hypothetical protein
VLNGNPAVIPRVVPIGLLPFFPLQGAGFGSSEGCYVASIRYGGEEVPESGIEYSLGATLVITIGIDGGRVFSK